MKDAAKRNEFRMFVGMRIRCLREKAGLTQMQLAFMSDLDRSFIQKVEHGRQSISLENAWMIAGALKCELSDIVFSTQGRFTDEC
ncbi:MAG: helix-turn-helix transcriptional regulator [Nitrospirota bacterium]